MSETCVACETRPVRADWMTVHDDGTEECMWSEAVARRALYCQTCYDAEEDT